MNPEYAMNELRAVLGLHLMVMTFTELYQPYKVRCGVFVGAKVEDTEAFIYIEEDERVYKIRASDIKEVYAWRNTHFDRCYLDT